MCVEGAQRGLTFGGAVAEHQPCAFQKTSSARKAPDTGWLPQPGWETWGRTEAPSAFRVWASVSGRLLVLYSSDKLGKGALLPQCREGAPGTAEGAAFPHRLSCLHIALSTPLPELTLTLVSPDLMHL